MAGRADEDDHWARWRAQDFTWAGLQTHSWWGWVVTDAGLVVEAETGRRYGGPEPETPAETVGRDATLQDYWRADPRHGRLRTDPQMQAELVAAAGQTYHRVHLPLTYEDGAPTGKADWLDDALDALVAPRLSAAGEGRSDRRAQFQGGVWLQAAAHPQDMESSLSVRYNFAVFSWVAGFDSATFSGDARFTSATFSGDARFNSATFSGNARFGGQASAGDGAVARRTFGAFDASDAVFARDADFSDRDFLKAPNFANARFHGLPAFHGSQLHQGTSFLGAQFGDDPTPEPQTFRGFLRQVPLGPRVRPPLPFVSNAALERMHQADSNGLTLAAWEAKYRKTWRDNRPKADDARFAALEAAFRTLKLAMEGNRDRIGESFFFRLELLARRKRKDAGVPKWERFASWGYDVLADYGGSVSRPLWWLLRSIVVFGVLYWGLGAALDATNEAKALFANQIGAHGLLPIGGGWTLSLHDAWSALTFSFNNVFRPLSSIGAEAVTPQTANWASAMFYGYGPWWTFFLRLLVTTQAVFSILMIFLSALAMRRRFQIS